MAVLQSTNVQGALCVNGIAVGGGKDFKYCCFTASSTWTPTQDLVDGNGFIEANLVGGGGGGGSMGLYLCSSICNVRTITCSAGSKEGCVGELFSGIKNITATDACTVTVGAGGAGGVMNIPTPMVAPDCTLLTASSAGGVTSLGDLHVSGGRGGTDYFQGNQYGGTGQTRCTVATVGSEGQCSAGSSCLNFVGQYGGGCTAGGTYCEFDTPNDQPKAGACYGFIGEPNGGVMCGVAAGTGFAGGGFSRTSIGNFVFSNPTTVRCNLDDTSTPTCKLAACTYGSSGGKGGGVCICNNQSGGSNFQFIASGSGGDGVGGIVVLKWQE